MKLPHLQEMVMVKKLGKHRQLLNTLGAVGAFTALSAPTIAFAQDAPVDRILL